MIIIFQGSYSTDVLLGCALGTRLKFDLSSTLGIYFIYYIRNLSMVLSTIALETPIQICQAILFKLSEDMNHFDSGYCQLSYSYTYTFFAHSIFCTSSEVHKSVKINVGLNCHVYN